MVSVAADCRTSVAALAKDVMCGCASVAAVCSWFPRKKAASFPPVHRPEPCIHEAYDASLIEVILATLKVECHLGLGAQPTCTEVSHIHSESHWADRVAVAPGALQQLKTGQGFCVGEPASVACDAHPTWRS